MLLSFEAQFMWVKGAVQDVAQRRSLKPRAVMYFSEAVMYLLRPVMYFSASKTGAVM